MPDHPNHSTLMIVAAAWMRNVVCSVVHSIVQLDSLYSNHFHFQEASVELFEVNDLQEAVAEIHTWNWVLIHSHLHCPAQMMLGLSLLSRSRLPSVKHVDEHY